MSILRFALQLLLTINNGSIIRRSSFRRTLQDNLQNSSRVPDDVICSQSCFTTSQTICDDALESDHTGSTRGQHTGSGGIRRTLRSVLAAGLRLYAAVDERCA